MPPTTDNPCLRIFVYGTLKRGGRNHFLLENAKFAGTGAVRGRLQDLGYFPALELPPAVELAGGSPDFAVDAAWHAKANINLLSDTLAEPLENWRLVLGEVFIVRDQKTLAGLDHLEDFRNHRGDLFTRSLVQAFTDTGPKTVWTYHMRKPQESEQRCISPIQGTDEVFWPISGIVPPPPPEDGRHRIFCYGSLLPEREVLGTAPGAVWRGRALLTGHRLDLTWKSEKWRGGVADVVPDVRTRFSVWGGLYDVDAGDLGKIDKREGHPKWYCRQQLVVWADGQPEAPTEAWVYQVVCRESAPIPASAVYKSLISKGARKRGLPETYVREVVDTLPEIPPAMGKADA